MRIILGCVPLNVSLAAQGTSRAPATSGTAAGIPPIHPLGPIVRVSRDSLPYIASIRVLSDGRVLANDTRGRRVVLFDSSLAHFITVADTTSGTARAYGASGGWLFPFAADSSLFADFASLAFLVIDPAGRIIRVIAAPPGSMLSVESTQVDPQGNLVSRQTGAAAGRMVGARTTRIGPGGSVVTGGTMSFGDAGTAGAADAAGSAPPDLSGRPVVTRDSTMILRVNIATKTIDTAAWLMAPAVETIASLGPAGGIRRTRLTNPMPVSDAWAMMPDGTIAALREYDYHVDWVAPNGTVTSTPKIAHHWEPITDSIRRAIIDSVRLADSIGMARMRVRLDSIMKASGRSGEPDADGNVLILGARVGGQRASSSNGGPIETPHYIDPDDLPSYFPPFQSTDTLGTKPMLADADGNLWIHVTPAERSEGGLVYDVVNRQGRLVDRIQIPGGTHIIGFGPGVVYLISREGVGYKLARARVR